MTDIKKSLGIDDYKSLLTPGIEYVTTRIQSPFNNNIYWRYSPDSDSMEEI